MMTPFITVRGTVGVLDRANIDTDQIIPARFLRKPRSAGYHNFLFADTPSLRAAASQAAVLVAGENFGCGSSREGAVYALVDAGIRCVIAPSFGDIFLGNAAQNGLLAITTPAATAFAATWRDGDEVTVDLLAQTIRSADGTTQPFAVDAFRRRCLLEGLDDVGLTLQHAAEIAAFEVRDAVDRAWARPPAIDQANRSSTPSGVTP